MVQDIEVLLVEDDLGDVELTKELLKNSKVYLKIVHVRDGQECMEYLRRTGKYETAKAPDLILLDLKMPRKDGRQVLSEMKADKFLKDIPVVVLTASHDVADITKTYGMSANHFVTKPIDFYQVNEIVNEIAEFWFTVVKFPDGRKGES
jgi:chemotaxis family two-component system response regulator Rcp1